MSTKIAAALHQVMGKVGYVQKTGKNQFHGYKYAGEADLLEKLRPAMVDAGLLLLPSVKATHPPDAHGNVVVEMEYTLAHKDGDIWPEKLCAVGCGNDMAKNGRVGDKGPYKAITGANKYLLFKLFQIETGDDPEKDERPADREPAPDPRAVPRPEPMIYQERVTAVEPDDSPALYQQLEEALKHASTVPDLQAIAVDRKAEIESLPLDMCGKLRNLYALRARALSPAKVS